MLEKYRDILTAAKELVKAEEQVAKRSDAVLHNGMEDSTPRQRANARASLDSACEQRNRVVHELHLAIVRAGIAKPFEDSYYGEFRGGTPDYPMMIVRDRP